MICTSIFIVLVHQFYISKISISSLPKQSKLGLPGKKIKIAELACKHTVGNTIFVSQSYLIASFAIFLQSQPLFAGRLLSHIFSYLPPFFLISIMNITFSLCALALL